MSKDKNIKNPYHYREVAESLGVTYLFGRWGLSLGSKAPGERRALRPRIIPLDGWITQSKEVVEEIKKRDYKL